jgi:hypothetical protein
VKVQRSHYEFEGLPLADVDPGTNILVTGPVLGGVRDLVLRMLVRRRPDEGVVFLAADTSGPETLRAYESVGGTVDPACVGVVDCTEEGTDDPGNNIHSVSSPSDLTGVGIEFSSLYESLHANDARQVRTAVYTLSPFILYASTKPVYRFLHTLTGRIRAADGLGVCAIDPDTVERETFSSLAQAFDARLELRNEDSEVAIRTQGLPDQPEGWQSLDGLGE